MSERIAGIHNFAHTYSDDVEINEIGVLVWVRGIPAGQLILLPPHFRPHTPAPRLSLATWLACRGRAQR